jgi:hypothetical protein
VGEMEDSFADHGWNPNVEGWFHQWTIAKLHCYVGGANVKKPVASYPQVSQISCKTDTNIKVPIFIDWFKNNTNLCFSEEFW